MGIIRVSDIKIFTNHGCLEEEAKIGSEYRVNIEVKTNLNISAKSDDLNDTVDYVLLNKIAKEEMMVRSKLLEHVAQRILNRIFNESQMIEEATVSVSKINPPIGGNVGEVTIILSQQSKS